MVYERHVLPNGLRVVTAPMPQAQSVSCFLMLAAGSRYETREQSGIAHFAEHMFFKGTERRPAARDIAAEIDFLGAEFNAFTGKEYTGYYVKAAAEHRDAALDVLVDMLRFYAQRQDTQDIAERLNELEYLMRSGTPTAASRNRLSHLVGELTSILGAYPSVVQIFQQAARLATF